MIFTQQQIEEILNLLEFHNLFVISTNFGVDILTPQDKNILRSFGVDLDKMSEDIPLFDKMFYFGRLTGLLSDLSGQQIEYNDFLEFIKRGQYIPLNKRERFELDIAKRATYTHLKGLKQRAKQDLESIILNEEKLARQAYETAISEETQKGVEYRKSVQSIVSDLGKRVGTWQHDWNRIVDTEMNNIFQAGRAEVFREIGGEDTLVYKTVYPQACRHCIRLYLKGGIGSEPIVYKLSDLIKNGTNIGKKVAEWKAVVGSTHPFCRCTLKRVPKGYIWSKEKQDFVIPKNFERRVIRTSKIKMKVGDKEFSV